MVKVMDHGSRTPGSTSGSGETAFFIIYFYTNLLGWFIELQTALQVLIAHLINLRTQYVCRYKIHDNPMRGQLRLSPHFTFSQPSFPISLRVINNIIIKYASLSMQKEKTSQPWISGRNARIACHESRV